MARKGMNFDPDTFGAFAKLARKENLLPIHVSPFYNKKIKQEVDAIGIGGPLYKGVYPTPERLTLRAPQEVQDFVEDHRNMPHGLRDVAIQKYQNRMLFFPTDRCASHCQYCFRTYVLSDEHTNNHLPKLEEKLDRAVAYLNTKPSIKEIIFSGGDPFTVHPHLLETAFRRFKSETEITDVRVHTRSIVFTPQVFRQEMCELLGKYEVRVYFHIIHPYETDEIVEAAIRNLQDAGVKTYNQFPILRGVNDHSQVLIQLMEQLDRLGVRQVSMFVPDPINYSATFRIPLARLFKLIDEFNWITPSWVNAGRLVLDTPVGKVRRENIVNWDRENRIITFEREGNRVVYHDFPESLDEPGNIKRMLWKQGDNYDDKT